jgi:hypothetical protein
MMIGLLQLAVVALYSASSRARFPKKGLRRSERILIVSSAVAVVASLSQIDVRALWHPRAAVVQSSASATTSQGSCAIIDVGMAESEVTKRLGPPDQRIADEEMRGPGAAVLLYKGSRCAVKVFDGRVEVIE